ncbi:MAG TPA: porin family protein [Pontibacter sp.]
MKNYLLLTICTLLSLACYAQVQEPEDRLGPTILQRNHNLDSGADAVNSGFGIKGGVSFANVYGSDADVLNASTHTNFHAGVYAQFALSNSFSLQVEGLYSRKGFEQQATENRFDYLELPLLAVYNITRNVSLHLGPQMSVMVAARQNGHELNLDDLNTFDYGLAGGAEMRIRFMRAGARYNLGFAGLQDKGDTGLGIGTEVKNSVLQLYVGIGF